MDNISVPVSNSLTLNWLITLEDDEVITLKVYNGEIVEDHLLASGNLQKIKITTNHSLENRTSTGAFCQLVEISKKLYICSLQISEMTSEDQGNYTLVGHFKGVAEPVQGSIRVSVFSPRNERIAGL